VLRANPEAFLPILQGGCQLLVVGESSNQRKQLIRQESPTRNNQQQHIMAENITKAITLDSREEAFLLLGHRDQHLRIIRESLGAKLVARGDTIQIEGTEEQVGQVERAFSQLRAILRTTGQVTGEDVKTVVEVIRAGSQISGAKGVTLMEGGRYLRPRTDGQGRYVQAMRENDVVICVGPAGTGKTYLAVGMAVTMLRQGTVKKIVLVRPAVEAGERLGFLPGDLVAKINPYLRPLFDSLNDLLDYETVRKYMETEIIEIVPLAYMRGRTISNAVIILDEGQNATVAQMKMFLTRMGMNSKIIVTGDLTQIDLPPTHKSGLIDAVHRLRNIPRLSIVYLDEKDIVRHPVVQDIVRAYDEEARRRKPQGG
jgi:phosphate starvation-inducible PhoH-like protein